MVNFAKRFFYAVITEWRDHYIDYKGLYKQIKLVKAAVLELAQAYANIKVITGDDAGKEIQLEKMEAERRFWTMLDENVLRVENWYNKQIDHFTEQFHILTLQAIQLQLIDEYDPFTRGLSTRVERELDRLHLGLDIGLSTHTRKDEAKIPLLQENPLFPLSKKTSINDVIKRVRTTTSQRRMSMDRTNDNYGIEDSGYIHDDDISSSDEDDSDVSLEESDAAGAMIDRGPASPRRITSSIQRAKKQQSAAPKSVKIDLSSVTKSHNDKQTQKSVPLRTSSKGTKTKSGKEYSQMTPRMSNAKTPRKEESEKESEDDLKKKPQHNDELPRRGQQESMSRSYTILKLRNLTKEDLDSTDMTRSSFVVAKELEEMHKIDRQSAKLKLQKAFSEFYRGISLLMNYATLNSEGIEKILTKHDKNIELGDKEIYIANNLSRCLFYKRTGLTTLMRETEHVFAMCFTSGHRTAAMKKLRVADKDDSKAPSTFRFGLLLGISLTFILAITYTALNIGPDVALRIRPILMCYRMMAMICLLVWGWGVDMYIWAKYRVNYVFIFEFDPRRHHRYTNIFEAASVMTVLVIGSLMLFLMSVIDIQLWYLQWIKQIPMIVHPLFVLVLFLVASIWYQVKSKMWLVKIVAYIFGSPFTFIHFPHFFIADQLVSIVIVLYDIEYFLCYVINDAWSETFPPSCDSNYRYILPMLAFLPPFWRFMQSLRRYIDTGQKRQLANAGKYSVAFFVISLSFLRGKFKDQPVFTALWIIAVIVGTFYSYYWDVKMDWSLGETKGVKHWGLRNKLLFPTYYYYFALISNFIMRVLWTLTISPEAITALIHPDLFSTLLAAIEIYRRCLWNIFRVENEQLNNIGKFRALNDMPLPLPVKNPFEEEAEEIV